MASIAVFDNASFVDTSGGLFAESDLVQAFLNSRGHAVTTFTATDAAGVSAALTGQDIVVFPEFELATFVPDAAASAVLASFVIGGGGLFVHGFTGNQSLFLNTVFGFSITEDFDFFGTATRTAAAAGTPWEAAAASLPANNGTEGLRESSLPPAALSIYSTGSLSYLTAIPFGAGKIIFIGWDWFDGRPIGSQDNGWLDAVEAAVAFAPVLIEVVGTPGDDPALSGSPSSETVRMLSGDDTYTMALTGSGTDRIDGGEGGETLGDRAIVNDTGTEARDVALDAGFAGSSFLRNGGLTVATLKNVEILELNLANGGDTVTMSGDIAASGLERAVLGLGGGDNVYRGGGNVPVSVVGEGGQDVFFAGVGAETMHGGAGFDAVIWRGAAQGAFVDLSAQGTNAFAAAGDAVANVEGFLLTDFGDQFTSAATTVFVYGFGGDDIILGSDQSDVFAGGAGGDYMDGRGGLDSAWYDQAASGVIINLLAAGSNTGEAAGDYFVSIEAFILTAFGDSFQGGDPVSFVYAGAGDDQLFGSVASNDWFFGGAGNDFLAGGTLDDRLEGGDGNDVFAFADLATGGLDTIVDFQAGRDVIQLTGLNFGGLAAGHVFVAGTDFIIGQTGVSLASANAGPTLLYDYVTGQLFFDADGTGAAGAVGFAVLSGAPGLSAADLRVVALA
jgi:Ca2+-binding RTX toxin-like protein